MNFDDTRTTLKEIKRIFWLLLLAFIVLSFLSAVVLKDKTEYVQKIIQGFAESKEHILETSGLKLALELFKNNMKVSAFSLLLGFIPFLFLPSFTILLNAIILGGFYQFFIQLPGTSPLMYFAGILPHGIIEIPAFLLAASMGIYLCKELSKKLLRRPVKPIGETLRGIIAVLIYIILPMLIVAALIEAFITPYVMTQLYI